MIHSGKVSARASAVKSHAARYLPSTASQSVTGWVISSSMLPDLRSSAHSFMEIAGIRNRYSQGWKVKNGVQVRLAALVEAAEIEGEGVGQHEKDQDEDIGERCREITRELAAQDDAHVAHGASV